MDEGEGGRVGEAELRRHPRLRLGRERPADEVVHQPADLDLDPFQVTYVDHPGAADPGRPAAQPFWEATSTGTTGPVTWELRSGKWSVVVMNPDGSPNVAAAIAVGVKVPALLWAAIGLTALGGGLLAVAALMFRARSRSRRPAMTPAVLAS